MRALGHIPDLPDARDALHPPEMLIGAGDVLPTTDWSSHIPFLVDQQGECCVGEMWRRMLHMRASIAGRPIRWPSAYSVWTPARQMGGSFPANVGVRPRDAAEHLRRFGLVAEERWPSKRPNIDKPLPWDVLQHGVDARLSRYSRLSSVGQLRCVEVRRALSAGFPVGFAMVVDESFLDGPGALWTGLRGPLLGGHAQVIVGHRPGAFRVAGSYGESWADRGYFWISDECIGSDECTDFYVGDTAPAEVT